MKITRKNTADLTLGDIKIGEVCQAEEFAENYLVMRIWSSSGDSLRRFVTLDDNDPGQTYSFSETQRRPMNRQCLRFPNATIDLGDPG